MSRLAGAALLVLLGLGIGLWLGFNPQGRALAEENMERANQYFAEIRADANVWVDDITPDDVPAATEESQRKEQASGSSSQSVALRDFWDATRQAWFSLLARFEIES
jgi:uncharacterized protein HemX